MLGLKLIRIAKMSPEEIKILRIADHFDTNG